MAFLLAGSRNSINSTATIAYLQDDTPYGTNGWDDGSNPSRGVEVSPVNNPAALLIFCTKLGSTIDTDTFIDLLSTYDPETKPESLDPLDKTYLEVDILTNGDGIYYYEWVVLKYMDDMASVGYCWKDSTNEIVYRDGITDTVINPYEETPASTATTPQYYKDLITSAAGNAGYVADYAFYDIIYDVEATRVRSQLAVDITMSQCGCSTDKSKVCDCCTNKRQIHDLLRLQIEGANANWAQGAYRAAAKNFDMIRKLITEANSLG